MRISEAEITLGVIAARRGDLELATSSATAVLTRPRQSRPSLLIANHDLTRELRTRYADNPETREYLNLVRQLST